MGGESGDAGEGGEERIDGAKTERGTVKREPVGMGGVETRRACVGTFGRFGTKVVRADI